MEIKVEKGRGYQPATARIEAGGRPHDRQHPARRVVLAGAPRQLRGRVGARRAAHRPRQAGARHRDQRRRRARAGGALRRVACWSSSCRCSPTCKGTDVPAGRARVAAGRSDPAASGRRPRAHGPLGQLPQGREHLLHRRPDPAHGNGAAEDAEPRPQVAERDQGSAGLARAFARHEARELAAGRASIARKPRSARTSTREAESCVTVTGCGS